MDIAGFEQAIRPGEIYTAAEVRRRLDVSPWAFRGLRKRLSWAKVGRQRLVRSDDVIELVETIAREQEQEKTA